MDHSCQPKGGMKLYLKVVFTLPEWVDGLDELSFPELTHVREEIWVYQRTFHQITKRFLSWIFLKNAQTIWLSENNWNKDFADIYRREFLSNNNKLIHVQ